MPSAEPPAEIVIRVKVPPGHIQSTNIDEFALGTLSTSLTVSALRQRIQTLVPSHPLPQHQRILYGGRALIEDGQLLADALNIRRDPAQTEYVVHLLVRDGTEPARSSVGTPHVQHAEHRPLQPQPVHGQAINMPGVMQIPPVQQHFHANPQAFGFQPMTRAPSASGAAAQQPQEHNGQDGSHTTSTVAPEQSDSARNLQSHRPHHHNQHIHHHTPNASHPGQVPPRPISGQDVRVEGIGPNGERFAIHQHTVHVPFAGPPGQMHMHMPAALPGMPFQFGQGGPHGGGGQMMLPQLPGPFPGMPSPFPLPGMAQPPQRSPQPSTVSALDRARNNMGRNAAHGGRAPNSERQQRYAGSSATAAQPNTNAALRSQGGSVPPQQRSSQPSQAAQAAQTSPHPLINFGLPFPLNQATTTHMPQVRSQQQSSLQSPVSVYLLSSPEGPRALVFTPDHGIFSGSFSATAQHDALQSVNVGTTTSSSQRADPELTQQQQNTQAQPMNDQADQQVVQAPADAAARQQGDPLALMQPFMGHVWLLLRVMIFAYFLLGSNFGWRRPVALALIGLGFWMIRIGLFGNGGLIRRWWDDIVHIDNVRDRLMRGRAQPMGVGQDAEQTRAQAHTNSEGADVSASEHHEAHAQEQAGRPGQRPFPTPEQVAQRLLRQRDNDLVRRLRERVRPVERALALFAASLWPGIGEQYVQALDQAREEEEVARQELERQREQAEQAAEAETSAKSGNEQEARKGHEQGTQEKIDYDGDVSAASIDATSESTTVEPVSSGVSGS